MTRLITMLCCLLLFPKIGTYRSYVSTEQEVRQYRAGSTPVLSGKYASTEQVVRQSQAGGTPVPSRWDSSPRQVGLQSQAGGTAVPGRWDWHRRMERCLYLADAFTTSPVLSSRLLCKCRGAVGGCLHQPVCQVSRTLCQMLCYIQIECHRRSMHRSGR